MTISRIEDPAPRPRVRVNQRLWRTRDGKRLVPEGHCDAAFLYLTPSKEVDAEEFEGFELDWPGEVEREG